MKAWEFEYGKMYKTDLKGIATYAINENGKLIYKYDTSSSYVWYESEVKYNIIKNYEFMEVK